MSAYIMEVKNSEPYTRLIRIQSMNVGRKHGSLTLQKTRLAGLRDIFENKFQLPQSKQVKKKKGQKQDSQEPNPFIRGSYSGTLRLAQDLKKKLRQLPKQLKNSRSCHNSPNLKSSQSKSYGKKQKPKRLLVIKKIAQSESKFNLDQEKSQQKRIIQFRKNCTSFFQHPENLQDCIRDSGLTMCTEAESTPQQLPVLQRKRILKKIVSSKSNLTRPQVTSKSSKLVMKRKALKSLTEAHQIIPEISCSIGPWLVRQDTGCQ